MSNEVSPTQNPLESPSNMDAGNAEIVAEAGLLDFATKFVSGEDTPQQEVAEEVKTEQQSEESVEEEVEQTEEADDTNIEAEEAVEEGEVDQEETSESPKEIDTLSFTDLSDQVEKIEIGGKEYTPAQLKSILGQEESAGTKARKAAEELAKIEAKQAELSKQEEWLSKQREASVQSDELATYANEYKALDAQYQQALAEEDAFTLPLIKGKMENVQKKMQEAQNKVQEVQKEAHQKHMSKVSAELQSQGYGNLLKNGAEADAWKAYATKVGLDQAGMFAAVNTPQLAIALDKARRFDELNSKKGTVLKSKGKLLKSSGKTVLNNKQKSEAAYKKRMAEGNPSDKDQRDYFTALANDVLSL